MKTYLVVLSTIKNDWIAPPGCWKQSLRSALYRVEEDDEDLIISFLFGGYPLRLVIREKDGSVFRDLGVKEIVRLAGGGKYVYYPDPFNQEVYNNLEVVGEENIFVQMALGFYGLSDYEELLSYQPRLVLVEGRQGTYNPEPATLAK